MPIAAVSGQARRVQAHDQSGLAQADFGDQALKAMPFVARAPRFTQVIIDNHHPITRPTESDSTFDESVLQVSAFAIFNEFRAAHCASQVDAAGGSDGRARPLYERRVAAVRASTPSTPVVVGSSPS